MATPYIGEIKMFAGNFAPVGWAMCDGALLPIDQYSALYQLLGTTYGGDGQTNFQLPDLRGRVPLHLGNGYVQGQPGGVESVTLLSGNLPSHTHQLTASNTANNSTPTGKLLAQAGGEGPYTPPGTPVAMQAGSIASTGGSQPHDNMQPYLVITFIIALEGIYPSQN